MTESARRTRLQVTVNGRDVTSGIAPYLKEFSFKDNAKGKADEVSLTLMDRDERFQGPWFIAKGSEVTASLLCLDWYTPGEHVELPMGAFTVDEAECSGPPDVVKVKAVTAAKTSAMSEEARTRGWETYTLERIAQEIADRHGYTLRYDAPEIPFNRVDQREASDIAFLNGLAGRYGVNLKVHGKELILYGAREWDAKGTKYVIHKRGSVHSPTSWSFKKGSQGTGKKAEVAYHDPARRETVQAEVEVTGPPPSGQTLTLNQRVENSAQAIALGQGALRAANEGEQTATLEWMGFPGLVAAITVELAGFGQFDGTYFVESAEHKLGRAYTTSAELRKTLAY
ncbi:phage late control D family protein [Megalodesulfovibrio paquesii]